MEILKKLYREEKGQGATEYMVLLGSVVAALIGGAYLLVENFSDGVTAMGGNVETNLSSGFAAAE